MSLTAANPGGWSLNEVLTSLQMTHLQNELLKAIDGVNGGTYTLVSPLQFAGADVRIAADLEVISGGEINIQNGGALNVLAGGIIDFSGDLHISSGGELVVESGGLVTLQNGSDMAVEGTALIDLLGTLDVNGTGSIEVNGGGAINLTSGGDINVTSADVTINGGAQILLNGGALIIGATGVVQANGGDINLGSGSLIVGAAGAGIQVQDAEDLVINGSNETFRITLTPAFNDPLGPWNQTTFGSGLLGWYQFDVSAVRRIWFALPVVPGDTLVDVFVRVDGDAMGVGAHAGLPATMPQIDLVRVDINGAASVLATKVDPSGSQPVYDNIHNIVLQNGSLTSGTMPQLATGDPLYVRVSGEFGANSQLGLTILSISGNVTARSFRNDEVVWN